ncbi:MAG: methylenetetrahydrofolate reductase C-terminal domain-containing protein [Candidatus Methanoperedens sp.]|nr:methylenetetrahydrofolate reductase C-terminal domain-containing protein [Candidatus Methanoperedens sp.]MCZ7403586.1 methylenetetrahydrofolate reductase C-terminal domain-containing protein [Candidatus Methanoperedens sp.]
MIISSQKEFSEILRALKEKNIFIIGCGKCATKLHVGGEPEVLEMQKRLMRAGKNIVGWTVLSSACNISSWDDVLAQNPGIGKSDALLVMSCGGGVSLISGLSERQVYPALDTESLGGVRLEDTMKELCGMCGECTVWEFGGICPVSRCPKGLLNGPCGGVMEGKCEVDERTCAWDEIYERQKKLGKLENPGNIHEPKDHSGKKRRQTV